jgi:hypothetical protein
MEQLLLPLHLLILAFIAWNVICADHLGLRWIQGKIKILEMREVKKYHYCISTLLGLMIITGFSLFWPLREFLLTRPQFYVKMGFVIALIINSIVISYLQKIATTKSFASLSLKEKLPLFISGAFSTVCWVLTATAGFYLIPE